MKARKATFKLSVLFLTLILSSSNIIYTKKNGDSEYSSDYSESRSISTEYIKLAKNLKRENHTDQAINYYKKALEISPNDVNANFELAGILYSEGKTKEAIKYYEKSIELSPSCSQAYFNTALCFIQTKETEKAITHLKKAIELNPSYTRAYRQLGILLHNHKRDSEAIQYFKKALQIQPDSFSIMLLLGKALKNMDKLPEAIQYFRQALEKNPNNLSAILEVANSMNMLCTDEESLEEAIELYKKALNIDPSLNSVRYNIAYTLKRIGKIDEALPYYNEVLKINPEYAQARFSRALAFLTLGDFDSGWKEYEWRWQAYRETPKKFSEPIWDGSNPAGKRILLIAEQGLGDTFQFIRYAQILKNLGATVIVQTQKPLATLLPLCDYIDEVVPRGAPLPQFDCYSYLMTMPLILKTNVNTVPDNIPYISADPNLIQLWKEKLSSDKNFKIGICWQGNQSYRTQALKHAVSAKSMHVGQFKPLAEIPGVSLYCLQKMSGEEQLNEIDFKVHTFGDDFDKSHGRFMDTAAIIKNLDLVVSVDTSICHLSAALGTKVWTILPKPADWRWMLEITSTPWYPNMTLFRQTKIGDWKSIMQQIANKLSTALVPETEISNIESTSLETSNTTSSHIPVEQTDSTEEINKPNEQDPISFIDMNNMAFEEVLDKLIIARMKYEIKNSQSLLNEIETLEERIKDLASIYLTKQSTNKLEDLTDQLCDVNKQLIKVDEKNSKMKDRSIFNKEFIDLTKKAQYIYNLKNYIKKQIRDVVRPD